ncbi:glutathione S-transferase family protein [Acidisphaera sp. S103]|uniref:glutathione S-transferase family protein n=1 Tax=Acidisphaera sp. S103 TaxID=1747223 RepID=UPI00131AE18B|nr:glutathione S-transferase family protein [Acidisphaera sp. S103]
MSDGFTLHGSPHSLPTYRVALMLRLCREGFIFRYVSFQRGMHLTPEFRALSRWGQVPVMEHKGRVFVQSAAILEYLAHTLGRFGAGDDEARQHIREWLFWDADRLMPPLYAWYSVELGRRKLLPLSFDPVLVAEFDRKGRSALDRMDQHLSGCRFLVGDATTIADICCYSDIAFARLGGKDITPWRNVVAWARRIEALPGFAEPFDLLAMQDAEIAP